MTIQFADYLANELALKVHDAPAPAISFGLQALGSLTSMVDISRFPLLPGSSVQNSFTGYLAADPAADLPARAVIKMLTRLCDTHLHITEYESELGRETSTFDPSDRIAPSE